MTGNAIGRLDPASGSVVEYRLPQGATSPVEIITDDRWVWFSADGGTIGRLDPATDQIELFEAVGGYACCGMVSAFGALWYGSHDGIGRIDTTTGKSTEITLRFRNSAVSVAGMTADHRFLWFTEESAGTVVRLDPDTGGVWEIAVPRSLQDPQDIVFDGDLWFLPRYSSTFGRLRVLGGASRLAGPSRFETAVAIANQEFPHGSGSFYLARADDPADAVAGGVLRDAPLLLLPRCGPVPRPVAREIRRVAFYYPGITGLGGHAALCDQMLQGLAVEATPMRLAGSDRFATASAIARHAFPDGATRVYLARADDIADAVAGGVLTDGPILVVPRCGDVPDIVLVTIEAFDPETVVALGGSEAVCEGVLQRTAGGRGVARLAGTTRFDTAVAIARHAFPSRSSVVYLARSDNPIDAVAGAMLTDGPILLVPPCGEIPAHVLEAIAAFEPLDVVALGGTGAICDAALRQAADLVAGSLNGRASPPSRPMR
jgi:putative cell wall-binding protein